MFYHAYVDGRLKVRRLIRYIKNRNAIKIQPEVAITKTEESIMGAKTARDVNELEKMPSLRMVEINAQMNL